MRLLIGSTNPGKINEFKTILQSSSLELVTPTDINLDPDFDVEETESTFKGNAILKAKAFAQESGLPSICDDSGLEVDVLDGRPGVYSKRYGQDDHHRCQKLLTELKDIPESKRTARFKTVVAFHDPRSGKTITQTGTVEGKIALQEQGGEGFGYDPIFIPDLGNGLTFAELGQSFKNQHSHRAQALTKIKPRIISLIKNLKSQKIRP